MLKLEEINGKNIWDILKLCVSEEQKRFVAGNDFSIIEAYISITGNGYAFPFGIYEDDTPIGFLQWEHFSEKGKNNYCYCAGFPEVYNRKKIRQGGFHKWTPF